MNKLYLTTLFFFFTLSLSAQYYSNSKMTLNDAINVAKTRSPQAQMAQLNFLSQYWYFRTYQAERLPSLNVGANSGGYDRSIVETRDYVTGDLRYLTNNTMSNSANLSIDQNIVLTGGKVSLGTSLQRLDQFDSKKVNYSSQPLTFNYSQPLKAYNALKWRKKIAPKEYESAKRNYLENMENIAINTTMWFFSVLSAQTDYDKAVKNSKDTKELYEIAKERFKINRITKSELLQLELSVYNSELSINNSKVAYDVAKFNFCVYIGIAENETLELISPMSIPNVILDYEVVLHKAYTNTSFNLEQEVKRINAESAVAQAKAMRGLQADLSASVGFSQTGADIGSSYSSLRDREVVGLRLSMPLYDWGLGKGKVKVAEAKEKLALTEIEQDKLKFIQDIQIRVLKFNNQAKQCEISRKAQDIANERYEITYNRFMNGSITVTDLNTAQKEKDDAQNQYISQLSTFWNSYYEIQKLSLFDYINKKDISTEFDKLIE